MSSIMCLQTLVQCIKLGNADLQHKEGAARLLNYLDLT
jgi:hypothetical protein